MDALAPVYAALGSILVPTLAVVIAVRHLPFVTRVHEPVRSRLVRLVRILGGIVVLFCVGAGVAATVLAMTQPRADAPVEQHRPRFRARFSATGIAATCSQIRCLAAGGDENQEVRFREHATAITAQASARSGA